MQYLQCLHTSKLCLPGRQLGDPSDFATADGQSIASSLYALKERYVFRIQASERSIHQPRRSSTALLRISCGNMTTISRVRPSIWNLSSRFGTLRLYAGQVRPSRCARLLVSAVLRFPATRLISVFPKAVNHVMRGKLRAHALPFLGALGSDLTRAGMPRVCLKVGFAAYEFFNAAVGMVCVTLSP